MSGKLASLVLTCEKYLDRQEAIIDTWASDCDYFLFVSSANGAFKKAFYINDDYASAKYKMFNAMVWIAKDTGVWQFDWFFIADDDTYANVKNIREYLATQDIYKPEVHGRSIRCCSQLPELTYPSGGAGILISRSTLLELVRRIDIDNKLIWLDVLIGLTGLPLINVPEMNYDADSGKLTRHRVSPVRMRALYKEERAQCA